MRKIFSLIAAVLFAGSMMADNFVLVTDASTLAAGDQIIITNETATKAISATQATNNRSAVDVTANENVIVPGENVQVITLEASGDYWMLNVGEDAYLYAAGGTSNPKNNMKTATAAVAGDNGKFAISITDNVATVVSQGDCPRNNMRYNENSQNGNPLFSLYAATSSVSEKVKIYKSDAPVTPTMSYYVVGNMTSWAANASYKLKANPAVEGEFMADITFAANDEFKVAYSDGTTIADENWFPTGMGNNYVILEAGDYTVYFRPAGNTDWGNGYFTAVKKEAPADPTNCAEAAEAALSVSGNNVPYNNGAVYTIEGYVTAIQTAYSDQYHNITFWMADTQDGGNVLEAYRAACASEADAPVVGDKVAVTGSLTKYGTTPEFAAGCTFTILIHTAIENTNVEAETVKFFENGQLFINKNGVIYNAQGTIVR